MLVFLIFNNLFVVEVETQQRASYQSLIMSLKSIFQQLKKGDIILWKFNPVSMLFALFATQVPSKTITSAHFYWSVESLEATCPAEWRPSHFKGSLRTSRAEPRRDETGSPALWGRRTVINILHVALPTAR